MPYFLNSLKWCKTQTKSPLDTGRNKFCGFWSLAVSFVPKDKQAEHRETGAILSASSRRSLGQERLCVSQLDNLCAKHSC